jgi:outer membrane lipoprotein carrier protein
LVLAGTAVAASGCGPGDAGGESGAGTPADGTTARAAAPEEPAGSTAARPGGSPGDGDGASRADADSGRAQTESSGDAPADTTAGPVADDAGDAGTSSAGDAGAEDPPGGEDAGMSDGGEATDRGGEGAGAPDDPVDAAEVVRRAREAYDSLRTLRAEFRQVLEMRVFDPPRRREGRGTWYQKKPSLFRMDFSDPEDDVIVADGSHLWLYYPSTHPDQVVRSDLQAPGRGSAMVDLQGRIFRLARTAYDPEYGGREEVDGEPAHLVVLTPRREDTSYRRVRVWVDTGSHLVRRLEFQDRSETVRTITLDELEPGVTLPDSLFRFEPPPDAEIFRG